MINIAPSKVRCHFSLKQLNTFGVKAYASNFVLIQDIDFLQELLKNYIREEVEILILGGGSNILFTQDFPGMVIKNGIKGIEVLAEDEHFATVKVGGGEVWHDFVLHAIDQNWGGIENLSLIPGTVGAAPIQNIGAYGVEQKDVFVGLDAIEIRTGKKVSFLKDECDFGYRNSIFKNELKGKLFITHVTFKLTKADHQINTSYGAISKQLEENKVSNPSIKDISDAVISIRNSKLPNPLEIGNCGSFFKNPEVPKRKFQALSYHHPELPHYPASKDGHVKIPAGWLIEQCGWKGKRMGNVGTFSKQALVLINHGNATGEEAKDFAMMIQQSVKDTFGIKLEPEVNIL